MYAEQTAAYSRENGPLSHGAVRAGRKSRHPSADKKRAHREPGDGQHGFEDRSRPGPLHTTSYCTSWASVSPTQAAANTLSRANVARVRCIDLCQHVGDRVSPQLDIVIEICLGAQLH